MTRTEPPSPGATRNPTWVEEVCQRAGRSLAAGATYFLVLAGVGWALGEIGARAVAHGFDLRLAGLIEAVPILIVMAVMAALAMRQFHVRDRAGDRLMVGSVAVSLVIGAELLGGVFVRAWGPYESLANLTTRPGLVFGALLVIALFTPLIEPMGRARLR